MTTDDHRQQHLANAGIENGEEKEEILMLLASMDSLADDASR